jgi:hypothetical protein
MAVLKQAEAGTPVPDLCREHGVSTATFYKWRAKFGGMDVSLMAKMKVNPRKRTVFRGRIFSKRNEEVLQWTAPTPVDKYRPHIEARSNASGLT